jgi:dipeptidyl aminopeptidase/acylaminoacyl peptidase
VYLHGGPPRQMLLGWHYMGYYSNDYALNQYLASRGFIVLAVNYRLGIGYGRDFQFPAKAGPRGASEYQDVQAGGRYLQSLADVDTRRVGVYGGSYGGYLTAMALARNSDLFAVGVDIHGVHDWLGQGEASKVFRRERYESAPDLKEAIDMMWTSSPASDLSAWRSPVLFIHGDDDRNVSIAQTVDLVQRLRKTGVHQEELVLVDETHSIQRYANELRMNAAVAEFLERYLLPRR